MASTSAVSMAMPLTNYKRQQQAINADAFFKPLPVRPSSNAVSASEAASKFAVKASSSSSSWMKEKAVTGLSAAAFTAYMVMPEAAEAASGVSPSLKNFLLSIVAVGVVLGVIIGAVVAVANFDPVKRT